MAMGEGVSTSNFNQGGVSASKFRVGKEGTDLVARAGQPQLGLQREFFHGRNGSEPGLDAAGPRSAPAPEGFEQAEETRQRE
jgi:hypothetical protein